MTTSFFILTKNPNSSDKSFEKIIFELKEGRRYGYKIVEFTGETTASREDIFSLIKQAKMFGYKKVRIWTNEDLIYNPKLRQNFSRKRVSIDFIINFEIQNKDLAQIAKLITKKTLILNLKDIYPYTKGHKKYRNYFLIDRKKKETQRHLERIDYFKKAIKTKKEILPVIVRKNKRENKYYLIDGFCRYMAFKKLGLKTIRALVKPNQKILSKIQDKQNLLQNLLF